ncbi:hypothetical protein E4U36_005908, partial [Claviceps purpurea]
MDHGDVVMARTEAEALSVTRVGTSVLADGDRTAFPRPEIAGSLLSDCLHSGLP